MNISVELCIIMQLRHKHHMMLAFQLKQTDLQIQIPFTSRWRNVRNVVSSDELI